MLRRRSQLLVWVVGERDGRREPGSSAEPLEGSGGPTMPPVNLPVSAPAQHGRIPGPWMLRPHEIEKQNLSSQVARSFDMDKIPGLANGRTRPPLISHCLAGILSSPSKPSVILPVLSFLRPKVPQESPAPPRLPIQSHRRCETRPSAGLDLDFHPRISTICQATRRTSGSRSSMAI
jgi:hypothetical protein